MESQFSKTYPNIAHWVHTQGWIEIGQDKYRTVDKALQALELELAEWPE
jgi:hypothetical protein